MGSKELQNAVDRLQASDLIGTVDRNRRKWKAWFPSEESCVDVPRADLYALVSIAKAFLDQAADDALPIAEERLQEPYWSQEGLYYSHVIQSDSRGAAIEITLTPPVRGSDGPWDVALLQEGEGREDHVLLTCQEYRTMGQLRRLLAELEGTNS